MLKANQEQNISHLIIFPILVKLHACLCFYHATDERHWTPLKTVITGSKGKPSSYFKNIV